MRISRASIVIAMVVMAVGIFASSASAFPQYSYSFSFGSKGSGLGQFNRPEGITTDSAGNVYVADFFNDRIQMFNSKGEFKKEFGKPQLEVPTDVAIDSKGNFWVTTHATPIMKFNSNGEYLGSFGEFGEGNGQFWNPERIDIDSKDNMWISDIGGVARLQELNSEGKYLRQINAATIGKEFFPGGIAIDSKDNIWAVNAISADIFKFNAEGKYISEVSPAPFFLADQGLGIDKEDRIWASGGNEESNYLLVYSSGGEMLGLVGEAEPKGVLFQPEDIGFDPSGNPWVRNYTDTKIQKWLAAPEATTEAATDVKASEANLKGLVNPHGTSTTYQFEYGTTTSYGSKAPASPESVGSGTSFVAVGKAVSGLTASTTYHFRVVATSAAGTTYGTDKTFQTESLGTSGQLNGMAVTEPFDGSPTSIANFAAKWSALGWASGSPAKGEDSATGWRPVPAFPTVNGAFFNSTVTDTGPGIAAVATMAAMPGITERHFSLWLDMSSPASTRAGYQLRFTHVTTTTSDVTLSKWVGGAQTVLATQKNYTLTNGSSFALVDKGSTVSAWAKTGAEFTQLLSASDSTFASGNAGVEASGNVTRLTKFKVGALLNPVANMDAALKALALNDPFTTVEDPLSGGGAWAALFWDNSSTGHNTGKVSSNGWSPYDPYPTINGAHWTKATFADTGAGNAVAAKLSTKPSNNSRYFSLWLNMPNPASAQSGYELRFTESASLFEVTMSKWQSGTKTVLASKASYSFPLNSQFALVSKAGTVSVWVNTASEFTQLLSASDSTFTSGYTGIEASGNTTRLKDFRSGPLAPF